MVLSCVAFADVSVKDLGDGTAEVTFFYGNPRATEVVVAGDFTNWQDGAESMTKVEKGWELKKIVPLATEMKYKFISDGNWTPDIKAPDTIDDGFGGLNGYVDVVSLVAIAKAEVTGTPVALPAKASVKFQTWSMFGFQTKFKTTDKFEVESSGVNLKSYWKFGGEVLPGVPVFVEIALAEQDGFNNIYNKGSLALKDGITNLGVDTLFDPIYFYGGQEAEKTYLGHFKTGIKTPYVEWLTGYKYAKLTPHKNVSWDTITDNWDAGYEQKGGFNIFSLGQALQKVGDVTVNATIAPNRSADRAGNQYGMYAFVNAKYDTHYVDFQYNGAYGTEFDKVFDDIKEADYIIGYSGEFGPVSLKANAVMNQYGANVLSGEYKAPYSPPSSDVKNARDDADFLANFATNVQVAFKADLFDVSLGYRMRGEQANLMYVNDKVEDQLGAMNAQRVWLNGSVKPIDSVKIGLESNVEMRLDKNVDKLFKDKDNMMIFAKPSVEVGLKELAGVDVALNTFAEVKYATSDKDEFARGTANSQFLLPKAGLKATMGELSTMILGAEVFYGFDNGNEKQVFHTLIGTVILPQGFAVQAGGGLRVANAGVKKSDSPFGAFVGANKKLSILQKPVLYSQFVFNMDPYKGFGDGQHSLNLSGFSPDSGVDGFEGAAAFRLALMWDL